MPTIKVLRCINCPLKCPVGSFDKFVRCWIQKEDGYPKKFDDVYVMFKSCPLRDERAQVELDGHTY
jgi:hypothetical protein